MESLEITVEFFQLPWLTLFAALKCKINNFPGFDVGLHFSRAYLKKSNLYIKLGDGKLLPEECNNKFTIQGVTENIGRFQAYSSP